MGSNVSAGGKLSITATGKNKDDANRGNINATASHFNANDVEFNAPGDINLNAGYQTTESKATSSNNSFGVGAAISGGMSGWSLDATGSLSLSHTNMTSSSKTAIDTVVNGKNSVKINNGGGNLTLHGAEITNKNDDGSASNGRIDINTGKLAITTPQNTNQYNSTQISGGFDAAVSIIGQNGSSVSPKLGYKGIHNDYASTEKTMSGIYGGKGGLNVNVSDTTTMKGGAITSAADASKNHMNTGKLITSSIDNKDQWSGTNASLKATESSPYNIVGEKNAKGQSTILPDGSILDNSGVPILSSTSVSHHKTSTTVSAIGNNIDLNAGSTSGFVSRDPDAANGYLKPTFDLGKINADLNKQQTVGQLMGQYTNMVIEATGQSDKFKPGSPGRMGLDMAVGAVSAGVAGGSVGSTVAGAAAGDLVNQIANKVSQSVADSLFPQDPNLVQQHKEDTNKHSDATTNSQDFYPFDSKGQNDYMNKNPIPIQDPTSDANKITNSIVHGLLTGGTGALVGVITSNSGDMSADVITASSSAMQQKAPPVVDLVAQQVEDAQKPIRQQNHIDNVNKVSQVINNQNKYNNEGDFMSALYHSLNPNQKDTKPTISAEQKNKVHQILNNQGNYKTPDDFMNALNQVFIGNPQSTAQKK